MNRSQQMATVAHGYVDAGKFAGVEWCVEVDGEVLDQGAVGQADVAAGTAIPQNALYRIYSMTKPIVSLLALQLVEQGKLRLYDMVAQYDPRFAAMRVLGADGSIAPAQRPITVEDLLTHRAGMTYEFIHGCHVAPYYRDAEIIGDGVRPLEDMMEALAQMPLAFQPGTSWRYSVSIDVLAHVCELAGGDSLGNLLEQNIFAPLGMSDTGFAVPESEHDRIMSMYGTAQLEGLPPLDIVPHELAPMDAESMYPKNLAGFRRGGHGLFSTSADYLKFARMLLTGRGPDGDTLISGPMLKMLQANRIPAQQLPLRIGANALPGYGWGLIGRVQIDPGQSLALCGGGEFGWAGAATTYFWVDPNHAMVGVVMTQYLGAMLPLTDDMRTAAYQQL
ncbi:MAG: serine hydrolase domain-containing protein [Pseudomonadota bacterium]